MARETLWLCLHLPRLGLEHWLKSDPEGGGALPRALSEEGRLCQLNTHAQARGLKPQMALSTALSICQDLDVRPRALREEQQTLRLLGDWATVFTSEVSLSSPSSLILQISDSVKLFGGADRIQTAAVAGLQAQGYSVSASLGPTPLSAQALAEAGQTLSLEALRQALPDAPTLSPKARWCQGVATQAAPLLERLPTASLFPRGVTAKLLEDLGLHHLGALRALPRAALQARLGPEARDRLELFWGTKPDLRPALKPRRAFYRDQPFLEDAVHRGGLRFPLRRLCGELAQWLRDRQLRTDRLSWRLQHRDHGSQILRVVLAEPQGSAEAFYELSWLQLSRAELLPAVDRLTLRVMALSPCEGPGEDLFQSAKRGTQETPQTLLSRLFARLGEDSCSGLRTQDDPRPERSTTTLRPRFAPSPRGAKGQTGGGLRVEVGAREEAFEVRPLEGAGWRRSPRPLWLLPRPQRLSGAGAQPRYRGKALQLRQGPERLCYGWWDHTAEGPGSPRDYWVAQAPQGPWLWIFQDSASEAWYLHGLFA